MQLSILAAKLNGSLSPQAAELDPELLGVRGLDSLEPGYVTFAEDKQGLAAAIQKQAAAVIVSGKLKAAYAAESAANSSEAIPLLEVGNARVAFAQALQLFHPPYQPKAGISEQAVLGLGTREQIADSAYIGPNTSLGADCAVAEQAVIYPGVVMAEHCRIGARSRVLPGVSLGRHCQIGADCLIGPSTCLGDHTTVGDDVEIGARCQLHGCHIGQGVRMDNLVNIKDQATIGNYSIVIAQSTVDEKAVLGDFVILASQSLADKGCRIGSGATMGARSLVQQEIPPGQTTWSGIPPLPHRQDMLRLMRTQLPFKRWKDLVSYARQQSAE